MPNLHDLEVKRDAILDQMRSIRSMKRGSITEQHLKVRHRGVREAVSRGPYYVFSRREGDHTASQRLRSAVELEQARKDIEEHKRFVALCREFELLTEQLGEIERQSPALEEEKKQRRWKSRKSKK